jgi:hypothetical protein
VRRLAAGVAVDRVGPRGVAKLRVVTEGDHLAMVAQFMQAWAAVDRKGNGAVAKYKINITMK